MRLMRSAREPFQKRPPKGDRKRRLEERLRKTGKEYGYYGNTVDRYTFVQNLVNEGYARAHVELALKILESKAGVRRITDMDVKNFIEFEIKKRQKSQ